MGCCCGFDKREGGRGADGGRLGWGAGGVFFIFFF